MAWIRMFTSLNLSLLMLLIRLMAVLTPALDVAVCHQNLPHETPIPGSNPVIKHKQTLRSGCEIRCSESDTEHVLLPHPPEIPPLS